ncbi:sulfite exporter TauE/SafE family protein [Candidatus Woesearchaeota archaeon]|nr:sulfite exporter TauE/SafE family protein [Candidatus Woesearchaeota archaeon]
MKRIFSVKGMHCPSCEVIIERKLKGVQGIESARVSRAREEAEISMSQDIPLETLQNAVKEHGYSLSVKENTEQSKAPIIGGNNKRYVEIGAIVIVILGISLFLKQFGLLPQNFGVNDSMSYGFIFIIGLVAATSTCLAVSGGLLLAISTKYNESNPNLTSGQKFKPHIYFNIGRIVSYTLLGGLIGIFGSLIVLSPKATGIITIIASLLMVLIGIQLLHIFPWFNRFHLKLPKFIAHKIYDASSAEKRKTTATSSFLFGASTFFLPCGFTQALQLYVLSKGDFMVGALTMLAFSLGTLPSLISVGALTSFTKGSFHRHFVTFSAVLMILLGIFNLPNGMALAGISTQGQGEIPQPKGTDENVKIIDGVQVIEMKVNGLQYSPSRFTITQGMPVEWRIDGKRAGGCAQVITVPKLGITNYLKKDGITVISFTPTEAGRIPFHCPMGMTTSGAAFNVVPGEDKKSQNSNAAPAQGTSACNANLMDCAVQKLSMEISREKGFYPNSFTVKKGIPVELEIDTKITMGGCMSTLVIPEYDVAHYLATGKTTLKFTRELIFCF